MGLLHAFLANCQAGAGYKVWAGRQASDRVGMRIDGQDAPAAAEELGGVPTFARGEVDGQRRLAAEILGRLARRRLAKVLGVMVQSHDERLSRALSGDGGEVARPVALLGVKVRRHGHRAMGGVGGHTL